MVVYCSVCSSSLCIRSCGSIYYYYVCSSTYRSCCRSEIFSKDWNNRKFVFRANSFIRGYRSWYYFPFKNLIAAFEVFFKTFLSRMCYEFKNKLLHSYAQMNYGFYLTRNSSFGLQVVSETQKKLSRLEWFR